jgi:hypothetical protein
LLRITEWTGERKPDWFYFPKLKEIGLTIQPLVIGGIAMAKVVYVFESQWDAFPYLTSWRCTERKNCCTPCYARSEQWQARSWSDS